MSNNNKLISLNNLLNIIFNENNVNKEIIQKELNNDHYLICLFLYILNNLLLYFSPIKNF